MSIALCKKVNFFTSFFQKYTTLKKTIHYISTNCLLHSIIENKSFSLPVHGNMVTELSRSLPDETLEYLGEITGRRKAALDCDFGDVLSRIPHESGSLVDPPCVQVLQEIQAGLFLEKTAEMTFRKLKILSSLLPLSFTLLLNLASSCSSPFIFSTRERSVSSSWPESTGF